MSDTNASPVEIGSMLAGKYRVDRVLGQGGMGVVVAATHMQLEQKVAIKFLLGHATQNAEAVVRFTREARAATKITSEHVVRVSDVGKLDDGAPYMVMEYLHGCDLSELLQQRGPLPIADAIDYVLQACEALAEAHVAGIIHRDLKPANMYLTKRADGSPIVKVLDFGISKVLAKGANDSSMTKTSALMGSPLYMSPEQMRSTRDVDARSDIWAIGIILHELLSGSAAFQAETMPELCARILAEPPPPLRASRPDAPAGLEAAIMRCLEKNPAARFQNVGELAQALGEFAPPHARLSVDRVTRVLVASGASVGTHAAAASVAGGTAPAVTGGTMSSFGGTSRSVKGSKGKVAVIGVGAAVVVGLAVVGGMVLQGRSQKVADASAAAAAATANAASAVSTVSANVPAPALTVAPVESAVPALVLEPTTAPSAGRAPGVLAGAAVNTKAHIAVGSKPKAPAIGGKAATGGGDPTSDFGDRK